MIQIVKDALGTKDPCYYQFNLAGRYVAFMPTVDYIAISRRISNEEERTRLKELVEKVASRHGDYCTYNGGRQK